MENAALKAAFSIARQQRLRSRWHVTARLIGTITKKVPHHLFFQIFTGFLIRKV
jgi:hypothetical protein